MRRVVLLLSIVTAASTLATPAAADPPTLAEVVRQVEVLLASAEMSPREVENAVMALQIAGQPSGREAPADLVAHLVGQLEQVAVEAAGAEPERRRELLRRARATLDLLSGKLQPPAPSPMTSAAAAPPGNDDCAAAVALTTGTISGSTGGATSDGGASCGDSASSPDVWYSYTAASAGLVVWDTPGSAMDTVLSLHSACPDAAGDHELACNDDTAGSLSSLVARDMAAGETVLVRVSGAAGAAGTFELRTRDTAGGISGTVTKEGTGEPRHDATVSVFSSLIFFGTSVKTAADGSYLVAGLSDGDWFARATDPALVTESWDDRPCSPCHFDTVGDPIAVAGALVEGIDFALSPGGGVAGTVSEAEGGAAISFAGVSVHDGTGIQVRSSSTDSLGKYSVAGLPAGSYTVRTSSFDFADELYDDLPCEPTCTVTAGTPVPVSAGSTSEGIDFALRRNGSLSGTVRRASDGQPLSFSGFVQVYDASGSFAGSGFVGSGGAFRVDRLPAGSYFAKASASGFLAELYSDVLCASECDVTTGTPIPVDWDTETAGIDFSLEQAGSIEGTVLTGDTLQPLLADVYLYDGTGAFLDWRSASSGSFAFGGLSPGSYFLLADSWWDDSYEDQLYHDRGCVPSCTVTDGDPVAVQIAATTSGIEFLLDHCSASSVLEVTSLTLFGSQTRQACRTIRVGPNVTIGSSGHLVLRAGRSVVLRNGFKVSAGGRLEVVIDPAVGSP